MNKIKLIDKNKVIGKIEAHKEKPYGLPLTNGEKNFNERLDKIIKYIKRMPSDYILRHGEWISVFDEEESKCSECGKEYLYPMSRGYNYCPNCGAKMS